MFFVFVGIFDPWGVSSFLALRAPSKSGMSKESPFDDSLKINAFYRLFSVCLESLLCIAFEVHCREARHRGTYFADISFGLAKTDFFYYVNFLLKLLKLYFSVALVVMCFVIERVFFLPKKT